MERWRAVWPVERAHRFPDRMRDSEANRKRLAQPKMRAARRVVREALRRGLSGLLVHVTVNLSGDLYNPLDHEAARAELRRLCAGLPAYYVLARGGRGGRLHAHLIGPAELRGQIEADPAMPRRFQVVNVRRERGGLPGLTKYLSKPNDEEAARLNHRRNPSKGAASERLLEAKADRIACGYSRLPVCSGLLNVPRERGKAAAPAHALLLACLEDARAEHLRERRGLLLAFLRSQARRQTRPAPMLRPVCCWPAAGLPVRRAAPLLVGHARPPPQTNGSGLK